MTTAPPPTAEQSTILDFCVTSSDNLMINALAGTGKSATLKMIDRASKTHPALYLVFNKRNQLEAIEAQKAGAFRSTTAIKTFNGLGHGIWQGKVGRLTLSKSKTRDIWATIVDDLSGPDRGEAWSRYSVVMDGIEKAKALGYVPKKIHLPHRSLIDLSQLHHGMDERPDEYAQELIDKLLTESIVQAFSGIIDFNDQIYMPALFGGTFPKFPRVMVDEYQDQSPVNHALLERLVTGRLIGVGDPFQNIYGFRGAVAGGMSAAVKKYSMTELPLSISFRCPSAIVEAARWRVPHFQWHRQGGRVINAPSFDGSSFPDHATIICRNNSPLLRMAFRLLSVGRSVTVVGSDLGPRIVNTMKRFGDGSMRRTGVLAAIESWRQDRLEAGSKSANDTADCMRVFAENSDCLSNAISYAQHIFSQTGTIQLLTGHKAKGLEFNNVFWIDRSLLDESHEQDANLAYVITTRSQNFLTELDSDTISW